MKKLFLPFVFMLTLLNGCTSSTEKKTHYYLLDSPTSVQAKFSASAADKANRIKRIVTLTELPKYLHQASLVMQLSDHQLHYSHFHMWAEPLNEAFLNALINDLNIESPTMLFLDKYSTSADKTVQEIMVTLTTFQVTHQSQVLLKGYYQLPINNTIEKYDFAIAVDLNADGYVHAVTQMRASIKQLARNITKTISALD